MTPKHIAHLTTLTNWGGIERILLDFLFDSHSKDLKHFLITTSSSPDLIRLVMDQNIPWFQPRNTLQYDPGKITAISRYLRKHKIDLVHSHNAHGNAWANLALLSSRNPTPFITGEHGSIWFVRPPIRWLDWMAQRRAQMIIANSNASALMLQECYGISASKIRVVYNGMQIPHRLTMEEARWKLQILQDVKVVGSVGRLDTSKDYWTLVDAAALVLKIRPDVMFVVIGGGPQETFLRNQVDQKGMSDHFYFAGWRVDARELIAAFDLYVSTSIHESFGNTLIEAALLGKAVIAPDVDGVPEAIVNNENGILLPPSSPVRKLSFTGASPLTKKVVYQGKLQPPLSLSSQDLAETIIELIDHPDQCEQMGQQGRERAERQFSIHRYVADLEKVYSDILGV